MSRRDVAKVLAISASLSAVVAPLCVVLGRAILAGEVNPGSVAIGAAMATIFLGVSPLLSLATWGTDDMRTVVIRSYVARVLGLVAFGLLVPADSIDPATLATSVVGSAALFLLSQSVGLGRAPRGDSAKSHN